MELKIVAWSWKFHPPDGLVRFGDVWLVLTSGVAVQLPNALQLRQELPSVRKEGR